MNTPGQILKFLVHEISIVDEGANTFKFLSYKNKGGSELMKKFAISARVLKQLKDKDFDLDKIQKSIKDEQVALDPVQLSQPVSEPSQKDKTQDGEQVELTEKEQKAKDLLLSSIQFEEAFKAYGGDNEESQKSFSDMIQSFMSKAFGSNESTQEDEAQDEPAPEDTQVSEVEKQIGEMGEQISLVSKSVLQLAEVVKGLSAQGEETPEDETQVEDVDKSSKNEGVEGEQPEGEEVFEDVDKSSDKTPPSPPVDQEQEMFKRKSQLLEMDSRETLDFILKEVRSNEPQENQPKPVESSKVEKRISDLESQLEDLKKMRRGSTQPVTETEDPLAELMKEMGSADPLAGGELGRFANNFADRLSV